MHRQLIVSQSLCCFEDGTTREVPSYPFLLLRWIQAMGGELCTQYTSRPLLNPQSLEQNFSNRLTTTKMTIDCGKAQMVTIHTLPLSSLLSSDPSPLEARAKIGPKAKKDNNKKQNKVKSEGHLGFARCRELLLARPGHVKPHPTYQERFSSDSMNLHTPQQFCNNINQPSQFSW